MFVFSNFRSEIYYDVAPSSPIFTSRYGHSADTKYYPLLMFISLMIITINFKIRHNQSLRQTLLIMRQWGWEWKWEAVEGSKETTTDRHSIKSRWCWNGSVNYGRNDNSDWSDTNTPMVIVVGTSISLHNKSVPVSGFRITGTRCFKAMITVRIDLSEATDIATAAWHSPHVWWHHTTYIAYSLLATAYDRSIACPRCWVG